MRDRPAGAQRHEFVGVQSRFCVADDGSDRRGLPRDLGLLSQRLQLSPQLPREIAEPHEIRLHGLELAERLLLAAAMLEDAGGLFDETAPVLRARLQHGVEASLAHDDVHFATQPRIAEQLLHIQEAAGLPVDRVLAGAVAEQRATDRHFAVLDGECPVAVVDRQLHFGATERTARGRPGEDDVLHLAAAQGLGALLSHDPGESVDDVRLAGSVRADDAGHAWFERERRGLRERLEAFERHALQVHKWPSSVGSRAAVATTLPAVGLTHAPATRYRHSPRQKLRKEVPK